MGTWKAWLWKTANLKKINFLVCKQFKNQCAKAQLLGCGSLVHAFSFPVVCHQLWHSQEWHWCIRKWNWGQIQLGSSGSCVWSTWCFSNRDLPSTFVNHPRATAVPNNVLGVSWKLWPTTQWRASHTWCWYFTSSWDEHYQCIWQNFT